MTADALADGRGRRDPEGPDGLTRLGPYRLVHRLGEGGMGVVHLALDRRGRAYALKVLRPHVAHDQAARARLAREVDTLGRIRSPHVAPIVDADVDGEVPYVVTRFVDGPSLDESVEDAGPLDPVDLHRLAAGLAEALDAIHSAGVVHRDIKPGNVLLVDDGAPVLIDFGIAHLVDDVRLTSAGLVMGTPGYLAPEVVSGHDVTPATDWWGWAATTAFAASGRPPFGRGQMDAVLARVASGEPDLEAVDPRIEPLLYAALSPYPDERPHQDEVVRGLESYAHGEPVTEAIDVRRSRDDARDSGDTAVHATPRTAALPAPAPRPLPPAPGPSGEAHRQALPPVGPWPPSPQPYSSAPELDEFGRPQVDPRIGRPNRSGTLLALLGLFAGLAVAAPMSALVLLGVWMVLARTADRAITSLVLRRHARGMRSSDVAVAVASSPWHLVVGAAGTLVGLVLPLLVGVCAMFASSLVVGGVTGQDVYGDDPVPLLAAAVFLALTAWWGPGGAGLRRGSRSLVRGATSHPGVRQGVVVLSLLAAAALVAVTVSNGSPTWWPLSEAPGWIHQVVPTL